MRRIKWRKYFRVGRLFSGDRCFKAFGGLRAEVAPTVLCGSFKECRRGVDGERLARDFEHGEVVDGIAKDGIGVR
jgi:hypothetical protein